MEIKAAAKFIRMSPKKVRLVVDLIRGMDVLKAETQLRFTPKLAKDPVLKLLRSAIANAENNFDLKKDNLFIKKIVVDEGPTLKRWQPKAHGRAGAIRKRSSHISIVLEEKVSSGSKKQNKKEAKK